MPRETYERLGSPEGELALAQVRALPRGRAEVATPSTRRTTRRARSSSEDGSRPVPMRLRNAPTKLMKELGYGKGYRYAHDEDDAYAAGERYLPDDMRRRHVLRADRSRPGSAHPRKARSAARRDATAEAGRAATSRRRREALDPRRAFAKICRMLDINLLRNDLAGVAAGLAKRGVTLDVAALRGARSASARTSRRARRSCRRSATRCRSRSAPPRRKGEDAAALLAEVGGIGDELKRLEGDARRRAGEAARLPARPAEPHARRHARRQVRATTTSKCAAWGTPRTFDFAVKDHVDLGEGLGLLDFATAAKLSGARFSFLRGDLARLHRALAQFMLDVHTREHGYTECYTPYIVNAETLDRHHAAAEVRGRHVLGARRAAQEGEGEALYLISTSEITLTNTVRDEILAAASLPIKLTAHTPCFRSEAGSYGKDTRGMIRQHQFDKVEMVQIVHPEHSYDALEELTGHAEAILQRLELPYRVMALCTGDIGFAARQDLRPRSVAAGAERLSRDLVVLATARRSRRGGCRRAFATRRASPSSCTR